MKRQAFHVCFLILMAILSGCNMKHYCSRRFPPATQTNTDSTSYIEKIVFRDTTILVLLPGLNTHDTIWLDTISNAAQSYLSLPYATSFAHFKDGKLLHQLHQKDSTIAILIHNAIKDHTITTTQNKEIIKLEFKNELTPWQHTQIYAAWILTTLIIISALWKSLLSGIFSKLLLLTKKRKPP